MIKLSVLRIEYTTYRFNRPTLISENEYLIIKNKLVTEPNFNPFKIETFYSKFKILILIYSIGSPISFGLLQTDNDILSFIGGAFLFFAFFGSFSIVPEWLSYLTYIGKFKFYHFNLLKKIKKSNDYDHFKSLVS